VVFIGASMALYFVNEYNILIDSDMVQNVFETDSTEALDFVNFKLLSYVLIAGVLPLLALLKLKVEFK
jgi:lipid A ethanolaminephosphotransferase